MNEDIHNEDEYFKRAYHHSKDNPPPELWNKITAELDKHDASSNRKKSATWWLVGSLIVLLSGSIATYYAFLGTPNKETDITINKSKVNNPSATEAQTSLANSENAGTNKHSDSSNINSFRNENALHYRPLHTDEDHSNSYSPQTIIKNREQNTQQLDHSPVAAQGHKQQVILPELMMDSERQLQQHIQPSLPVQNKELINQAVTGMKRADGTTTSIIANNSSKQLPEATITENVKPQSAFNIKDTTKQEYTLQPANKKNKNSFTHYWTFTPFISADLTHYKLDNDEIETNNNGELQDKTDIKERESHKFSYSAGVMAKLQLNRKLGVKTGVIYSYTAIGIQPQTLYATANGSQSVSYKFITSSGYAYVNPNSGIEPAPGDSISSYITQHHLQYISIPAMFNYTILDKRHFSLDVATGVSTNILLSTIVKTEVDDIIGKEPIDIHKLQGLQPLYFSYVIDANLQFYMSKHINASFIPSFKYAINPMNKNNIVKTYPYSFGIGAGITYHL